MADPRRLREILAPGLTIGLEAIVGVGIGEVIAGIEAQDQGVGRVRPENVVRDAVPVFEQAGGRDSIVAADDRPIGDRPRQALLAQGAERPVIFDL